MSKTELSRKGKKFTPKDVLETDWSAFTKALPRMTEDELKAALDYEVTHQNRKSYVFRLHRKYNQVRYDGEKEKFGIAGVQS
jgi:hypothetical protein